MVLTKSDIAVKVHELGFTKKTAVDTVESLLEIIKQTLDKGDDVLVSGFGKFCVKNKNSRRLSHNVSQTFDLIYNAWPWHL